MAEMHLPQDARCRNSITLLRGEANNNDIIVLRVAYFDIFFPLIAKSHIVFGMRAETEFLRNWHYSGWNLQYSLMKHGRKNAKCC